MITESDIRDYIIEHVDELNLNNRLCYLFFEDLKFSIDEKYINYTTQKIQYLDGSYEWYFGKIDLNKFILYNRKIKLQKLNYESK
jgi:hypothetical protein